jgi:hypothetical protein
MDIMPSCHQYDRDQKNKMRFRRKQEHHNESIEPIVSLVVVPWQIIF